jgi:hypothetical protein
MKSHTFEAQYFQPLPGGWQLQPLVRYYSQSAADFYGPTYNFGNVPVPWPSVTLTPKGHSNDWRLSTYGTVNLELKLSYQAFSFLNVGITGGWYKAKPQWSLASRDRIENPACNREKGLGRIISLRI